MLAREKLLEQELEEFVVEVNGRYAKKEIEWKDVPMKKIDLKLEP